MASRRKKSTSSRAQKPPAKKAAAKKGVAKKAAARARESERAQAARQRKLQEKKRSESSKKGWETRRNDPASMYRQMVSALSKYKDTHTRNIYAQFRKAKYNLYMKFPFLAQEMARDAIRDAGWSELMARKFAKLS